MGDKYNTNYTTNYGPSQPEAPPPAYGYMGPPQQQPMQPAGYGFVAPPPQQQQPMPPPGYGFVSPTQPPSYQAAQPNPDPPVQYGVYGNGLKARTPLTQIKDDLNLRAGFLRKVYAVLFAQLLVTFGVVAVFTFVDKVRDFINGTTHPDSPWPMILWLIALFTWIIVYCVIMCAKSIRRKHPWNLVFLLIYTLAMSYMCGMLASYFNTKVVVMAVGITLGVTGLMTVFGMQTKLPFTPIIIVIFVLLITMMSFGIACIFVYSNIMIAVYGALGAAIFSLFLLLDTYLIMQGARHEMMMEEYIFCALMLYMDVVLVFMYVLMCLGGAARN